MPLREYRAQFFVVLTLIFGSNFFLSTEGRGQGNCCDRPECRDKIDENMTELKNILEKFDSFPTTEAEQKADLAKFYEEQWPDYIKLKKLIKSMDKAATSDSTWLLCFNDRFSQNLRPRDENSNLWFGFLLTNFLSSEFTSPEFAKGFGVHVDIHQGVSDLGKDSEAYSFASRALLSYTFAKRGKTSGGHWRVLMGPSLYYFNTEFYLFVNARAEYRLLDFGLANKQFSIGNMKLIADANAGDSWIVGGGVGVEIYQFGFSALYQRQNEIQNSHLLIGIFYRFQFNR